MKLLLKHSETNQVKKVKIGFSWTTLFFGPLVPLFRLDFLYLFIMLITTFLFKLFSNFIFAFTYNKIYLSTLVKKSYKPCQEKGYNFLLESGLIDPKLEKDSKLQNNNIFIALDIKTIEKNSSSLAALEIYAFKYIDGFETASFHRLIEKETLTKNKIIALNFFNEFSNFIADYTLVGDNIDSQISILKSYYNSLYKIDDYWFKNQCIDSLDISHNIFPMLNDYNLETIRSKISPDFHNITKAQIVAQIYLYKIYVIDNPNINSIDFNINELKAIITTKNIFKSRNIDTSLMTFDKTDSYLEIDFLFENKSWNIFKIDLNNQKFSIIFNENIDLLLLKYNLYNLNPAINLDLTNQEIVLNEVDDLYKYKDVILDLYLEKVNYYIELKKLLWVLMFEFSRR